MKRSNLAYLIVCKPHNIFMQPFNGILLLSMGMYNECMDKAHKDANPIFTDTKMREIHSIVANNGYSHMPNVIGSAIQADACVRGWMGVAVQSQGQAVLNANQLTSLNAMISYVAYKSGIAEFRIERQLSDRFNIPNAKCLSAASFDLAIRYLIDNIKN